MPFRCYGFVVNHHKRVAYIANAIGTEMGLPPAKQKELILAGDLHDIGAFSLEERIDTLAVELKDPYPHAKKGYTLLKLFEPLSDIAPIVRFHHLSWGKGRGFASKRQQVPSANQ